MLYFDLVRFLTRQKIITRRREEHIKNDRIKNLFHGNFYIEEKVLARETSQRSHPEVFQKVVVLGNFVKSPGSLSDEI